MTAILKITGGKLKNVCKTAPCKNSAPCEISKCLDKPHLRLNRKTKWRKR